MLPKNALKIWANILEISTDRRILEWAVWCKQISLFLQYSSTAGGLSKSKQLFTLKS